MPQRSNAFRTISQESELINKTRSGNVKPGCRGEEGEQEKGPWFASRSGLKVIKLRFFHQKIKLNILVVIGL